MLAAAFPHFHLAVLCLPTGTLGSSIAVAVSQDSTTAGKACPQHLIKSPLVFVHTLQNIPDNLGTTGC